MCYAAVPYIVAAVGAGLSYDAQRKQQNAVNDYNQKQDALLARQKALALTEQQNQDARRLPREQGQERPQRHRPQAKRQRRSLLLKLRRQHPLRRPGRRQQVERGHNSPHHLEGD